MKRLLLSTLALILLACRAATGTPPPQSTTPIPAPAAEVTPQTIQANNPTPAPPVQTSPPASTPQDSQANDPAPTPPDQPAATGFTPQVTQVGDPAVNYASIEFTADNRYMVWFEMTDTRGNQIVQRVMRRRDPAVPATESRSPTR
ncbi:hypothetical protein [Roseiflexus sp.]